ncbi:MAG TPA: STAS domain-containing protein [Bacteroidales bacterium]|nr:STAS domain-containing protein [Bacteroidales bacterium]HPT22299.1 STAS domain-containing protein [Bacteroidales bacterium]
MINIERKDNVTIISFNIHKINALVTDEIRETITKEFDNSNSKVVIDLKGVEYIDSSGFGCFLSIMKAARNNYGFVKFANPEPRVMDVFKILNLHTVFQIYDDMNVCVRSFK